MKIRMVYLLAAFLVSCPVLSFGSCECDLCAYTDQPLACLESNFEKLYSGNYPRFWKILRKGAARAEKCDTVVDTKDFLNLAVIENNNAEFNEFFSEVIERMVTQKTECFLEATSITDSLVQERIFGRLRHPLYIDVAVIDNTLKYRVDVKYKLLVDRYFREKK